jgi:hypothetical protein
MRGGNISEQYTQVIPRENASGIVLGRSICLEFTLPSSTIDQAVQINTDHGNIASCIAVVLSCSGSPGWVGNHDISTDVPHLSFHYLSYITKKLGETYGKTSNECTPDKTSPATNSLNKPKREDDHTNRLCNTIETSSEQLGVGASDSKGLEDAGAVVGDNLKKLIVFHYWEQKK